MTPSVVRGLTPRELAGAASRHRGLLAGGLAAAAVAVGLGAVAPDPEPGVPVLTAARDLAAGVVLAAGDLRTTSVPQALVPGGALTSPGAAVGRLVGGPVRQGEPLTDVRLLGSGLLEGTVDRTPGQTGAGASPAGAADSGGTALVAAPLRVAEPAAAAIVEAGDLVDVLGASAEGGTSASVIASRARVLSVPDLGDDAGEGSLLVVAVDRGTAGRLAAAAVTDRLSLLVLPR